MFRLLAWLLAWNRRDLSAWAFGDLLDFPQFGQMGGWHLRAHSAVAVILFAENC